MSSSDERPTKIRKLDPTSPPIFPGPDVTPQLQEEVLSQTFQPKDQQTTQAATATFNDPSESGDDEGNLDLETAPSPPENKDITGKVEVAQPALSKSQLKKRKKQQEWEAGKEYRKVKRREKAKEKQARKASERQSLLDKVAKGELDASALAPRPREKGRPARPIQVPVTLIIDCDFEEYMMEKELISLGAQLTRCYSDNRTSIYRSHVVISSWKGKLKERFETVLAGNHQGWKGVRFIEEDFMEAAKVMDAVMTRPDGGKLVGALKGKGEGTAEKTLLTTEDEPKTERLITNQARAGSSPEGAILDPSVPASTSNVPEVQEPLSGPGTDQKSGPSIVYLSSDSPHTLSRLSPNTSYIIGGIVDKNRHKGLCYKRAVERGIPTAKLPIGEYMTMQSRTVLTVNHVVEIMLKWLETGDWGEAFLSVIPKRKEAKLRVKESQEEKYDTDDEETNVLETEQDVDEENVGNITEGAS